MLWAAVGYPDRVKQYLAKTPWGAPGIEVVPSYNWCFATAAGFGWVQHEATSFPFKNRSPNMKRFLLSIAMFALLTTAVHAADTKALVRISVYDFECAPLPGNIKLMVADAAEHAPPDQLKATTNEVHAEFERMGKSSWCATMKRMLDKFNQTN